MALPDFLSDEDMAALEASQGSSDTLTDEQMAALEAKDAPQYHMEWSKPHYEQNLGSVVAGGLSKIIPAVGDEVVAGGNALIDALLGGPGYSERLAQARVAQKDFEGNAAPGTSTALDIGAGLLAPMAKAGTVGKRALVEGFGYGFGEGEGSLENRAKSGLLSALLGGATAKGTEAIGSAAKWLGKEFPRYAQGAEDRAFGITKVDRKEMLKGPAGNRFEEGAEHPATSALETAKEYGVNANWNREEMMIRNKESIDGLRSEIRDVLGEADAAAKDVAMPQWNHTKKFLENLKTDEAPAMKEAFNKADEVLNQKLDGTLNSLQDAKIQYNEMKWTPETATARKKLHNAMTQDLKESIENRVDDLAKKGEISGDLAGKVKKLNRDEGDLISLQKRFRENASAETAPDAAQRVWQFAKRTGGGFAPMIFGAVTGTLPQMALAEALLAYGMSPAGAAVTAKGLRSAGPLLSKAGTKIEKVASPLARALITGAS